MTTSWFCSDLHWGHKNIEKFRTPLISSEKENRKRIQDEWKLLVGKRDDVYVLGDVCFKIEHMEEFKDLPGARKWLVRGNHDQFDTQVYLKYFNGVYGLLKYKEFWLSHAPIHPNELRNKINLHGHVHYSTIEDERYVNCCPEYLWPTFGSALVSLDQLRKHIEDRNGRLRS